MKTADQVKPNYAPVYAAALYPQLAEIFVKHGYALAVHGSLKRDFDLVAVPWAETPSEPKEVIKEITTSFCIEEIGVPAMKNHGRVAHTISVGFGECALDLSFVPKAINWDTAVGTLTNCCQLLDGWHCDTAWTEWDESVRKQISELLKLCIERSVNVISGQK